MSYFTTRAKRVTFIFKLPKFDIFDFSRQNCRILTILLMAINFSVGKSRSNIIFGMKIQIRLFGDDLQTLWGFVQRNFILCNPQPPIDNTGLLVKFC